jgi:hypothetical protein
LPLRARLNNEDVFAFNYDEDSWAELKKQAVFMQCCDTKAVLKKSKLGTLFFAHHGKGDCASEGESAEHIYFKNLIAKIAIRLGWTVATEKEGGTPDGEKWIADVYCTKGNAKLAFEVQWSPQTNDEFLRRQEKYKASNIRTAWLYRLKGNKRYFNGELPYGFDIPLFGMRAKSKSVESLYLPQFDEPVESFIEGMLQGKLVWSPKTGQPLIAQVIPHYEPCWNCGKMTGVVLGVSIKDENGSALGFERFTDDGVPQFLLSQGISQQLSKLKIGQIEMRHSKTQNSIYLSNGCFHCNVLMGNHFIDGAIRRYDGDFRKPVYEFLFPNVDGGLSVESDWHFNGMKAEYFF